MPRGRKPRATGRTGRCRTEADGFRPWASLSDASGRVADAGPGICLKGETGRVRLKGRCRAGGRRRGGCLPQVRFSGWCRARGEGRVGYLGQEEAGARRGRWRARCWWCRCGSGGRWMALGWPTCAAGGADQKLEPASSLLRRCCASERMVLRLPSSMRSHVRYMLPMRWFDLNRSRWRSRKCQ